MNVPCPQCQQDIAIPEALIRQGVARVTCDQCSFSFVLRLGDPGGTPDSPETPQEATTLTQGVKSSQSAQFAAGEIGLNTISQKFIATDTRTSIKLDPELEKEVENISGLLKIASEKAEGDRDPTEKIPLSRPPVEGPVDQPPAGSADQPLAFPLLSQPPPLSVEPELSTPSADKGSEMFESFRPIGELPTSPPGAEISAQTLLDLLIKNSATMPGSENIPSSHPESDPKQILSTPPQIAVVSQLSPKPDAPQSPLVNQLPFSPSMAASIVPAGATEETEAPEAIELGIAFPPDRNSKADSFGEASAPTNIVIAPEKITDVPLDEQTQPVEMLQIIQQETWPQTPAPYLAPLNQPAAALETGTGNLNMSSGLNAFPMGITSAESISPPLLGAQADWPQPASPTENKGMKVVGLFMSLMLLLGSFSFLYILYQNDWSLDFANFGAMVDRALGKNPHQQLEPVMQGLEVSPPTVTETDLATGERVLVVQGNVTNKSERARKYIYVKALIKDRHGRTMGSEEAPADNIFTKEQLAKFSKTQFVAHFNPAGQQKRNMKLDPGQSIPYMVVLTTLPADYSAEKYLITTELSQVEFFLEP